VTLVVRRSRLLLGRAISQLQSVDFTDARSATVPTRLGAEAVSRN
jgi:hypothetical protein